MLGRLPLLAGQRGEKGACKNSVNEALPEPEWSGFPEFTEALPSSSSSCEPQEYGCQPLRWWRGLCASFPGQREVATVSTPMVTPKPLMGSRATRGPPASETRSPPLRQRRDLTPDEACPFLPRQSGRSGAPTMGRNDARCKRVPRGSSNSRTALSSNRSGNPRRSLGSGPILERSSAGTRPRVVGRSKRSVAEFWARYSAALRRNGRAWGFKSG